MKLKNTDEIDAFQAAVDQTKGDVWLVSPYGDRYNLKSALSRYVAVGKLLSLHGDALELFCDKREDEAVFYKFFAENPQVL